jgi:hypothetical protein
MSNRKKQSLWAVQKKVAQTETIWAILVNSSTPIESKVTQKILVMSREILKKNRIYVKQP